MRRPLFVLALAWVIGVLLARTFPSLSILVFVFLIPLLLFLGYAQLRKPSRDTFAWVSVILSVSLLGILRTHELESSYHRNLHEFETLSTLNPVVIQGEVAGEPRGHEGYWRVPLVRVVLERPRSASAPDGVVDLWIHSEHRPALLSGDIVHATGNLQPYSTGVQQKKNGLSNWYETRQALGALSQESQDWTLTPPVSGARGWRTLLLRWRNVLPMANSMRR